MRNRAGLTQEQLAARLDLRSAATISMWESGKRRPSSGILPALAEELGCSIAELFADCEEEGG